MLDLYTRFAPTEPSAARALALARLFTLFWGVVLIVFASGLRDAAGTVVELGLSIASFTYGALLGVFLLGIAVRQTRQSDALIAFSATILVLIACVFGIWYSNDEGWVFVFRPGDAEIAARGLTPIAWPWFPVIGSAVTLGTGSLAAAARKMRESP